MSVSYIYNYDLNLNCKRKPKEIVVQNLFVFKKERTKIINVFITRC